MVLSLVALLSLVSIAVAAPPPTEVVSFTVREPAGVARSAHPASASVPLPRGRMRTVDALWLAGPDEQPALFQAQPLGRWPDGTIRWLLLDFLADVPARGETTYTLRLGAPPRVLSPSPLRLEAGGTERTVDTGPLRLTVAEDGRTMVADGGGLSGPIPIPSLRLADHDPAAATPEGVGLETKGPVRTEFLLTGRYAGGVAYELRLAVFAGQSFLRVRHTVTALADAPVTFVRSLAFTVPGRFLHGQVGVDSETRDLPTLAPPRVLAHRDATPALLDGERVGQHADGWARVSGGTLAVTVVTPYFWQEYPMAFRAGEDRLALDLIAGDEAPVELGTGAAKTYEAWIACEPTATASPPAALAAALRAPLVALPRPSWVVATRALPQAIVPSGPEAGPFLDRLASAYARYRNLIASERWDDGPPVPCEQRTVEHPRVGLYGALNWGDWQFPGFRSRVHGCDSWGNLEYDLPQVLGLAWAATANRTYFDGLGPAARHYRDVDIIHHAPERPRWVGRNHPHRMRHFSFATTQGVDLGHTWSEGLVTYHRLTGDVRALAAARRMADALDRRVSSGHNPRQLGWPMIALVAVHDATGETRHLEAARAYAKAALVSFRPTPAAGNWMMGILADGLAAVHASTGDKHILEWLTAYADALVAVPDRYPDARYSLPLGYLAAVTGNRAYEARARAVVRDLRVGGWGKPLANMGRTGFRLLAGLQATAERPATAEPGAVRSEGGEAPAQTRPRRSSSAVGARTPSTVTVTSSS